jgi:hypothetical protein
MNSWTRRELIDFLRKFEKKYGFAGAWRLERVRRKGFVNVRWAIKRVFGSLRRGKEIAGVQTWPIWTRERAREEILALARQGKRVSKNSVLAQNPRLVAGAVRAYGSWRKALEASAGDLDRILGPGTGRARQFETWSREKVVRSLQVLHRTGRDLRRLRERRGSLYSAAQRWLGGWRQALEAAGVPPPPGRRDQSPWTPGRILRVLRKDWRAGRDLRTRAVRNRWKGLVSKAISHFQGWHETLRAARVPIPPPLRKPSPWTRDHILRVLRQESLLGRDLRSESVMRRIPGLYRAAKRQWGGWHPALQAAGIPPPARSHKWTPEKIIQTLRQKRRGREDLGSAQNLRRYGGLHGAAVKRFGSWRKALAAAGIAWEDRLQGRSRRAYPKRSDPRVRDLGLRLRRISKEGGLLNRSAMTKAHPSLVSNALRWYGSWARALRACGLDPREHALSMCRRWTRKGVLRTIRDERRSGTNLLPMEIYRKHHSLYRAALKSFGGWRRALAAAGVPVPPTQIGRPSLWTRERVVHILRGLWKTSRDLRIKTVKERSGGLISQAYRFFGSWKATLAQAGISWDSRAEGAGASRAVSPRPRQDP